MKFSTALSDFLWGLVRGAASGAVVGLASVLFTNGVLGKVTEQTTENELMLHLLAGIACMVFFWTVLERHVLPKK